MKTRSGRMPEVQWKLAQVLEKRGGSRPPTWRAEGRSLDDGGRRRLTRGGAERSRKVLVGFEGDAGASKTSTFPRSQATPRDRGRHELRDPSRSTASSPRWETSARMPCNGRCREPGRGQQGPERSEALEQARLGYLLELGDSVNDERALARGTLAATKTC